MNPKKGKVAIDVPDHRIAHMDVHHSVGRFEIERKECYLRILSEKCLDLANGSGLAIREEVFNLHQFSIAR